ncbi:MAG: hypothetical protein IKX37_01580 [Bacteroidales bacterium]|nr:hypothetical protein [Bacteroidales bacterium]
MKLSKLTLIAAALVPAALLSSCGPKQLTDKDILTLIYNQAGGEQWSDSSKEGWLTEENIADWHNVKVNDEGRVTSLKLYGCKGVIPAEIGGLTELETLYISMDNSEDDGDPINPLPSSIGKLEKLTDLSLNVKVPCEVPPLDKMPDLTELFLRFDGAPYPAEIASRNLEDLSLNGFVGAIPAWVYEMAWLKELSINPDKLESGIAPEIGNLTSLERLNVDFSQFIGSVDVPDSDLPTEAIFDNLKNLKYLFLRGASTSGTLPPSIGDMPELKTMILCNLGLTGELPAELGNLPKIETLEIYRNELTGEIPAELFNATTLKQVWFQHNHLSGPLPKEVGNLVNLESLDLSYNELSGPIPAELGKCTKLGKGVFNDFSHNQFDAEIPAAVQALENFSKITF